MESSSRAYPQVHFFWGSRDPQIYISWEKAIDDHFKWNELCADSKVRFAQTYLRGSAECYWFDARGKMRLERREHGVTWREMRSTMREGYLGKSYERRLLDRWYHLRQDARPVSEYIKDFQWFAMKSNTAESEDMITSRFLAGLHRDIQKKLSHWKISTCEKAYDLARKCESYQRKLVTNQSQSNKVSISEVRPNPNPRQTLNGPTPSTSQAVVDNPSPVLPPSPPSTLDPSIQTTLDNIARQLEQMNRRFDRMDRKFDHNDNRLGKLSKRNLPPGEITKEAHVDQGFFEPTPIEEPLEESQGEKIEPTVNLSEETPESAKEPEEEIMEETSTTSEIIELTPSEETPEAVKELEEDTSISSLVEDCDENGGSPVEPLEEEQKQAPVERPQEPATSIEDLQSKLPNDPPVDLLLLKDTPPTIEFAPVTQCPKFRVILDNQSISHRLSPGSNSYFLPFPESYHVYKAGRLHFTKITQFVGPVLFATYFWQTLWNLLGVHGDFSSVFQTRVKPKEPKIH